MTFSTSIAVLSLILVFAFGVYAQEKKCNLYAEPGIGVTFCAPPAWKIEKRSWEPYAVVIGEARSGHQANINLQLGSYTGSLSAYADGAGAYILKNKSELGITSVKVNKSSEFNGQTKGIKLVLETEVEGNSLKSIQYYFKGADDALVVVTATITAPDVENIERLVDASLKTFKIDAKPVKIGTDKN